MKRLRINVSKKEGKKKSNRTRDRWSDLAPPLQTQTDV